MSVNTRKTGPLYWNLEIWRSNYDRFTSTLNCIPNKNPFFVFLSGKAVKIPNGVIQTISRPSPQQITLDVLMVLKRLCSNTFINWLTQSDNRSEHKSQTAAKCFWSSATWLEGHYTQPCTQSQSRDIKKKKEACFIYSSHSCSWVEMRRCRQPAPSASQPPWSTQPAEAALPSSRLTSPVMMAHVTAGHTTPADFLQVFFFFISPANNFPCRCPFLLLIL